jgi:hypothetical protein
MRSLREEESASARALSDGIPGPASGQSGARSGESHRSVVDGGDGGGDGEGGEDGGDMDMDSMADHDDTDVWNGECWLPMTP